MLDIVVSFDTTGSMGPAIAEVRRKVDQFINTLFDEVTDLRTAIIAHGDYIDYADPYLMQTNRSQLTNNRHELSDFVKTVPKTYGGDADEAYEYVFQEVARLNWRADANKVFIVIGDADPHEIGYTYGAFRVTKDWRELALALVKQGIKIYPVQALNNARYNDRFYKQLATFSDTPHLRLAQFSNVTQLLTAITYKQQSDERLTQYGQQLQESGQLDRSLAEAMNMLLNATNLIGGVELSSETKGLESVPPWRFQMLHIDRDIPIKEFVTATGAVFKVGRGFYELTKPETVQEKKEVVLRDSKGDMYTGDVARDMIGLPYGKRGTVRPMRDLGYSVFIQSTSPNRKLIGGTRFLYEA